MKMIPELINNFNVYKSGNILMGISGEVTLPDLEGITETLSGTGILGEIETTVIGRYGSLEQEIPFRVIYDDMFSMIDPTKAVDLTLRGSIQVSDGSSGAADYKQMRIVFRGKQKKIKPGKVEIGKAMESSITLELTYIMIEIGGKKKLELDKLNSVFKVNGVDLLEKIRKQC